MTRTSEEVSEINVQEKNRKNKIFSLSFVNSIFLILIIAFLGWMYFSVGPHLLSSNSDLIERLVEIESETDRISREVDNTRGDYLSSSVYKETLGEMSVLKERITLIESKLSEFSNLKNNETVGKNEELEILIAFALVQSAESEFNFFGRSERSSLLMRLAIESLKRAKLPNNSPVFRELDLIEKLIESTGALATSAIYKRLSKIIEALAEASRKEKIVSASALKSEAPPKSLSEVFFDELKLLASVRIIPGKSSKELLDESGLVGEFFLTKELIFLVSKIQREVAENRLHDASRTIGIFRVMLEDYPGELSIIIEQVKEVENLLSRHEKVDFSAALTFISQLLTKGQ